MEEIVAALIGATVGALATYPLTTLQRNAENWKLFQENIGIIKSKFLLIEKKSGIEGVAAIHKTSLNDLNSFVCRVRPYVFWECKRRRLIGLLNDFNNADQRTDSGFLAADPAGNYKGRPEDCFSDPAKAVKYLAELLEEMTAI